MAQARFTPMQKLWHWITVLLIVVMATTGLLFAAEVGGAPLIRAHQATGQVLIVVLMARLITKFRVGPLKPHAAHAPSERLAARSVHTLLYTALTVSVISGYISASALQQNVLFWPVSLEIAWSPFGDAMLSTH
ncbi:MAG: cytochrome b/b6 domain-containing protein, partial [Pseudomonadota bacterium]